MHCKHCGNQIDNDSKFCIYCGGKTLPINPCEQGIQLQKQNINTENIETVINAPKKINSKNQDKGILFSYCILVCIPILFMLIAWNIKDLSGSKQESISDFVLAPLAVLFCSVPLILGLYSKRKKQKLILSIIGAVIIVIVTVIIIIN